ncbi:MAG: UDP-N-acetylglucosamine 1-carboxyvinyltransferase [Rickettsiales bacterium]|jgi:UDP-N-acetylglucosamine 1-carboxyvinyltransferase|nr:UDP-N-acetylglucosamine 1-carboxyvinyltransferase [Rickettsiales bacterium]
MITNTKIAIEGGCKLQGQIRISGSKNASLPILAATLLTSDKIIIDNLPHLNDISVMINLLLSFGANVEFIGHGSVLSTRGKEIAIKCDNIQSTFAPYDLVNKMRASIIVLGALLARFEEADISLPGGCAIGLRPINFHLEALKKMGAEIEIESGHVKARAKGGLKGAHIVFDKISVGATENILIAATLAKGTTIIENAALEPEVMALVDMLVSMGAKITQKERVFTIEGVDSLSAAKVTVMPDRIEAGSYALATLITDGEVELKGINRDVFQSIEQTLLDVGADITEIEDGLLVKKSHKAKNNINIETLEYPGFPTDMQAQFCALLAIEGVSSTISEKIWENRFMHIQELNRMGANITVADSVANITSVDQLSGAEVSATDLRASMALIIAALAAKGRTVIDNTHHIDRGYEAFEEKLSRCGAKIYRIVA